MLPLPVAYWCLLGLSLLGLTATIGSQFKLHHPSPSTEPSYVAGCFFQCLYQVIMAFALALLGIFVVIVIGFRNTYYDYFVLNLFLDTLIFVWAMAGCGGMGWVSLRGLLGSIWGARIIVGVVGIVWWVLCWWLTGVMADRLAQQTTMVMTEPQRDVGQVTRTSSSSGRGASYYADINGVHYQIPEYAWFRTLQKGDTVQFIHDSRRSVAFRVGTDRFTPFGAVGGTIGALMWLATLLYVGDGLVTSAKRFRRAWFQPPAS